MRRTVRFAVVLGLVVPGLAIAHPHSHSGRAHSDDTLGWAIRRDGLWHVSETWDMDSIENLPSKYGDDFLYIRDGEKRYVITDPGLVERAARAQRQIKMHTTQINALASVSAQLAMSRVNGTWERKRLQKAESKLEGAIERGKEHGDDTRQAERDLKLVREQLAKLEEAGGETLTETERRELTERQDRAREDLDRAVAGIRKEMREILREALQKDLATSIR
jgi:hypothetical protein